MANDADIGFRYAQDAGYVGPGLFVIEGHDHHRAFARQVLDRDAASRDAQPRKYA